MGKVEVGIIGGSGLYGMPGLTGLKEEIVETPFGAPSDAYMVGELDGRPVAFLARHGRGHRILPSELNFRANIWGMKTLGVEYILSVSAVGSLKEEHKPTDFVIPDQFIDRTFARNADNDGVSRSVAKEIMGRKTEAIYARYRIVAEGEKVSALLLMHQKSCASPGRVVTMSSATIQ